VEGVELQGGTAVPGRPTHPEASVHPLDESGVPRADRIAAGDLHGIEGLAAAGPAVEAVQRRLEPVAPPLGRLDACIAGPYTPEHPRSRPPEPGPGARTAGRVRGAERAPVAVRSGHREAPIAQHPPTRYPASMSLLDRVIHGLILDLLSREELELQPETDVEALAARVLERVRQAANHAHVGREVCAALLADPTVEELYASDSDIVERLNYFYA